MQTFRRLSTALMSAIVLAVPAAASAGDPDVQALEREMEELEAEMERLRERLREAMDDEPRRERGFGGLFRQDDGELAGRERRDERRVHKLVDNPEALREAAREMERALEESDILESLAEMMISLSEDITVVEDGDSLSLEFDGESVATVESDGEDRVTLRAMGRRLTVEMD